MFVPPPRGRYPSPYVMFLKTDNCSFNFLVDWEVSKHMVYWMTAIIYYLTAQTFRTSLRPFSNSLNILERGVNTLPDDFGTSYRHSNNL